MRIISGHLGGRRFAPSKGRFPTRPTTDLAREALFNVLSHRKDLSGVRFLDLFGGLGGVSLEAVSRGCEDVTYVDKHPGCVGFVRETAVAFGVSDAIRITRANVEEFLKYGMEPYDIVFADPPYRWPKLSILPEWVFEQKLLKKDGILVVEHDVHTFLEHYPQYRGSKKYGQTVFSFFENIEDAPSEEQE